VHDGDGDRNDLRGKAAFQQQRGALQRKDVPLTWSAGDALECPRRNSRSVKAHGNIHGTVRLTDNDRRRCGQVGVHPADRNGGKIGAGIEYPQLARKHVNGAYLPEI
jgi:hypothetical protein